MAIRLPLHKTKIVCTIGPSSRQRPVLRRMMRTGMNVARLNFSHGTLEQHRSDIQTIRSLSHELGAVVAVLADLPGPKIRIGKLTDGSITLVKGGKVVLTTKECLGTAKYIPVQYREFPRSVSKGGTIYLNDGFIQLKVVGVKGDDVSCRVVIGGQLLSHKGLNLPGARLTVDPVTERDLALVKFGLEEGVDAFSVSFAKDADDIRKVKAFAESLGKDIHVVAKIERSEAIEHIDAILQVADGIMIARGDLGVEIPIEQVPVVQKQLIFKANLAGKPVITATQMLESMTENIRPTRAEVTDVANAILDGTDALMLSEETAIGKYPVDAVGMMARIARVTERERSSLESGALVSESIRRSIARKGAMTEDVISLDVVEALRTLNVRYVLAPTVSGGTPRRISRYKGNAWILSFSPDEAIRNFLALSYGVYPFVQQAIDADEDILAFLRNKGLIRQGDKVLITRRLPNEKSGKINSLRIVTLR